jgi:hypothetical protein
MPWLRLHSEARCDPKLELLSDAQFRVWFRLLCFANDQPERGTIAFRSMKLLAVQVSKGDEALLAEVLALLVELNIIDVDDEDELVAFVHWTERQYDKPSDAPQATRERKARQRDKSDPPPTDPLTSTPSRDVTPMSRDVTRCHGQEEKREEEKEETTNARASASLVPDVSTSSSSLSEQLQRELNIYTHAVDAIVAEYAPQLEAIGKTLLGEAAKWRQDNPTGRLKNFENWLRIALKPDSFSAQAPPRASPTAPPSKKYRTLEETRKKSA